MLKSLHIKNFRSLKDFKVAKLGRVNLVVGKNNSGKSSVLEALRIYSSNANGSLMRSIANSHGEPFHIGDYTDTERSTRFQHFFYGRKFESGPENAISIGEVDEPFPLTIEHANFLESEEKIVDSDGEVRLVNKRKRVDRDSVPEEERSNISEMLVIGSKDERFSITVRRSSHGRFASGLAVYPNRLPCSFVPTQLIKMDEIADGWDNIALTEFENSVKDALRIIEPDFEDIAFVKKLSVIKKNQNRPQNDADDFDDETRIARVKLRNLSEPVPLNSLGDGMARILQLILKVFPAKGGILLIDEFENGLHFSVQEKVWLLLFELAEQLDIQIFATTHSWDCIESFTKVAVSKKEIEGVLFRVGRSIRISDNGNIVATVFDENSLANLTQADVEVR